MEEEESSPFWGKSKLEIIKGAKFLDSNYTVSLNEQFVYSCTLIVTLNFPIEGQYIILHNIIFLIRFLS